MKGEILAVGLAITPPMGWNSFDSFMASVTEEQVREHADYMAVNLRRYGWQYVVVDYQWYMMESAPADDPEGRLVMDEWGRVQPAPDKHPSGAGGKGFRPLSDYVHSKGLKFGIHIMRGIPRRAVALNTPVEGAGVRAVDIANTKSVCGWLDDMYGLDMSRPGAQEYLDSLFRQYASWGVDFVKIDDLSAPYDSAMVEGYRKAIDSCGRPMVISTSPGDTPIAKAEHVKRHANMWRVSGDFWDKWEDLRGQFARLAAWAPHAGPGHWPDADMLPLGLVHPNRPSNFTPDEQVALMTLWAVARSPLMFGGDFRSMDAFTLGLLSNPEVLGVNQSGVSGGQVLDRDGIIAWTVEMPGGDRILAVFNTLDRLPFETIHDSGLVTGRDAERVKEIALDISGASLLRLEVDSAGDGYECDHANWIEPWISGPSGKARLTSLAWNRATCGWGKAEIDRSVSGGPLSCGGRKAAFGIGTHADSVIEYPGPHGYDRLMVGMGLDDAGTSQGHGSTVRFRVRIRRPDRGIPAGGKPVEVGFGELGLRAPAYRVRDLWRRRDLGTYARGITLMIPAHGAWMLRLGEVSGAPEAGAAVPVEWQAPEAGRHHTGRPGRAPQVVWDGKDRGREMKASAQPEPRDGAQGPSFACIRPGVGPEGGPGLVWEVDGAGWKQATWTWGGDERAGTDISGCEYLSFPVRMEAAAGREPDLNGLSLVLGSAGRGGRRSTAKFGLRYWIGDGDSMPDGAWHRVRVPLSFVYSLRGGSFFDPAAACEIAIGTWSAQAQAFRIFLGPITFE